MHGATALPVERWEQVFNPDRYLGTDYVSSSALTIDRCQDGSTVVAAAWPGRYKVRALSHGTAADHYLLVRPTTPAPRIRGLSFVPDQPLNRDYAAQTLARATRLGATWASIVVTGGVDLDVNPPEIALPCSWCSGTTSLDDLGWLIDEARRQGYLVAVSPEVWATSTAPPHAGTGVFTQPGGRTLGDMNSVLDPDSPLIPQLMGSYARFVLEITDVASRHHASALFLGNEASRWDVPLLRRDSGPWHALLHKLRGSFDGRIWLQGVNGCSRGSGFDYNSWVTSDLALWRAVDGITSNQLNTVLGSGGGCGLGVQGNSNATADQMAENIRRYLASWHATKLSALTDKPVIWTEFYPIAVDGVSYDPLSVGKFNDKVRDNQEIVDYFEAQMQAMSGVRGLGYFVFEIDLANGPRRGLFFDPLTQPALAAAIATWWGGDPTSLAPCFTSAPSPGLLLSNDFEPGPCLLERQDTLVVDPGWTIIPESPGAGNHVLHASGNQATTSGRSVPVIGRNTWSDYSISLRLRFISGEQSAVIIFRASGDGSGYVLQLGTRGPASAALIKNPAPGRFLEIASGRLSRGLSPGDWRQVEIRAVGQSLTVIVDGARVLAVNDAVAPLLHGGIVLGVGGRGGAVFDFDDLRVEGL